MKTVVYESEKNLVIKEKVIPELEEGEALIRVSYVGICGTDLLVYNGGLERVNPPVVLGHEFSGTVEKIKGDQSSFKVGDRVTAEPLITCQICEACRSGYYNVCTKFKLIGVDTDGAMAEFVKVPIKKLFHLKQTTSLKDAAFVEPLAVGVHMVNRTQLEQGQTALIIGGGPIGLVTASVAKINGANVYISEINPYRIKKAKELGFSTIDPTTVNLEEEINSVTEGEGAHVTFEVTGTKAGVQSMINNTRVRGTAVIAGLPNKPPITDLYQVVAKELQIKGSRVYTKKDYEVALQLIENGDFNPKHITSKIVPFDQAITKGFESIEIGEPVIKILIDLENEGTK